jgi:hypothetical protein
MGFTPQRFADSGLLRLDAILSIAFRSQTA